MLHTFFLRYPVMLSILLFGSGVSAECCQSESITPLKNAHAHNDYYHTRPLLDALDRGFTSIEADVFLVDGRLLVAHSLVEVTADRTLEGLYLKPLQDRVRKNAGRIYPGGPSITLLIDIKTNGTAAFAALHELLKRYADIVSETSESGFTERAVTVIISGDRDFEAIRASSPRFAGVDGRLSDLDSSDPADLLPLISDNWTSHFRYRGKGSLSEPERQKLRQIVETAHSKGRRVRFWATPEDPQLWKELRSAGVDLIGTDDLDELSRFLRE